MAPIKCCVVGCTSTNKTHRLYSLPKDDKLRALWLSFLVSVNSELLGLTKDQLLNKRVCQKHFERHQLDGKGDRLKDGYPCLFSTEEFEHEVPLSGDHYDHNYGKKGDLKEIVDNPVVAREYPVDHLYSRSADVCRSSCIFISQYSSSRCGSVPENGNEHEPTQADVHVVEESAVAADPEPQDTESPEVHIAQEETDNDSDLLDILGSDFSIAIEYGPEINKEVANRFEHISTTGLNKETRKELVNKYLVPANSKNINAPELNPEIKAAINEQAIKRDKAIELKQKQISAGISCLGKIISNQLALPEKNLELIKDLMDVGRILCDVQHTESITRRNFALYSVKKEMKDQLTTTKIDKLLVGEDLPETLKVAKIVSKSSIDLKVDIPKKPANRPPARAGLKRKRQLRGKISARQWPQQAKLWNFMLS